MHVVVLGGGSPREVGVLYTGFTSRSLLPVPVEGRLLDHIRRSIASIGADLWFVSDDDNALHYASQAGFKVIRQTGSGLQAAISAVARQLGSVLSEEDLVAIIYGDIYADPDFYRQPVLAAERGLVPGIVVTSPAYIHDRFTRVSVNEIDGTVSAIGDGDLVYAGGCILRFNDLVRWAREGDTVRFLKSLDILFAVEWLGPWVDIDTPWDYMLALRLSLDRLRGVFIEGSASVSERAVLEGPVYIDAGARVDHNAVVKGPAFIGKGCLVGVGAFLRNHVFLSEGVTIGAFTEFKRSIALDGAYVASHCYIADSIIGMRASVAPFTVTRNIIYDAARIPKNVAITTSMPLERLKLGAVIRAGAHVEPHSTLKPLSIV